MKGKIKKLLIDKRCGFINGADRKDYFFHASALKTVKYEEVEVGMAVEFEASEGEKGLRAEDVYPE